jgi:Domain of unknown function (DUF4328)
MLEIRNNAARAREITVIFVIMIAMSVLTLASVTWQYLLLSDIKANPGNIDMPTLELSDTFQMIVGIGSFIVAILAVIFFIRWFRRAYYNLHAVPGSYPSFTEGWAAGCWFVPFLNLVRPYQIMKEIWDGTQKVVTHRLDKAYSSSIVGIWWALYLVTNIYSNITVRVSLAADDVDSLVTARSLEIAGEIISIPAIIITIVMIKRAQNLQQKLWEEALEPGESVFSIVTEGDTPAAPAIE